MGLADATVTTPRVAGTTASSFALTPGHCSLIVWCLALMSDSCIADPYRREYQRDRHSRRRRPRVRKRKAVGGRSESCADFLRHAASMIAAASSAQKSRLALGAD